MSFGLLDLLGALIATIFVVATLMTLPVGWIRAAVLVGGTLGYAVGWWTARTRSWEYKLILPTATTLLGIATAWLTWATL